MKPFTWGIDRALKRFHFEKKEVVMVGDQLMTDIRAAHRAGDSFDFGQTTGRARPLSRLRSIGRVNAVFSRKSMKIRSNSIQKGI